MVLPVAPSSPALHLVLESEAFAGDADDERVVEDAIKHRHGEHAVASEGAVLPKPHQL